MPNKTTLDEVKQKLPKFVQIIENTYKGMRYKAEFIDTDYNEKFTAIVGTVINIQQGCKTRSNLRRSESSRRTAPGIKVPIEEIKNKLPRYLSIDESSYTGIRNKAKFYDKEYDTYFESLVCNVLRHGKGFCKERKIDEFKKCISIPMEVIEKRIQDKYPNLKISLIKDSYVNTQEVCTWKINNSLLRMAPFYLLGGYFENRASLKRWKTYIKSRDNHTCFKCECVPANEAHHILTISSRPDQLLNLNNGVTLCKKCHTDYHAKYKNEETAENFYEFVGDTDKNKVIQERLNSEGIFIK